MLHFTVCQCLRCPFLFNQVIAKVCSFLVKISIFCQMGPIFQISYFLTKKNKFLESWYIAKLQLKTIWSTALWSALWSFVKIRPLVPALKHLHWLPIWAWISFKNALVCKIITGHRQFLSCLSHQFHQELSAVQDITLVIYGIKEHVEGTTDEDIHWPLLVCYTVANTWNNLPKSTWSIETLVSFRWHLKINLFRLSIYD